MTTQRYSQAISTQLQALRSQSPCVWINPQLKPYAAMQAQLPFSQKNMVEAQKRFARFAPLLSALFPELSASQGVIESHLLENKHMQQFLAQHCQQPIPGKVLVKADHSLPIAGSVKARGGFYAVLYLAEQLAQNAGILGRFDSYAHLGQPETAAFFSQYTIHVASTGNLGLSIGLMGQALGFQVVVHMSQDAKAWKKERLREKGVRVIEHGQDYTVACSQARSAAHRDPSSYFIDDENSKELFLGYSTAAFSLSNQLHQQGRIVDRDHPLFVYLPCGVGGAPGGICFGLKQFYGDAVHCFFVEPVGAPCMLYGLLTRRHAASSITELGFGVSTAADGLAVGCPSQLVGTTMEEMITGCITEKDEALFLYLLGLYKTEQIAIEPSAAAGYGGLCQLLTTAEGKKYLTQFSSQVLQNSTHLIWLTGGAQVPEKMHQQFRYYAEQLKRR